MHQQTTSQHPRHTHTARQPTRTPRYYLTVLQDRSKAIESPRGVQATLHSAGAARLGVR